MTKKKKKDKNIISITREDWLAMKGFKQVICNHSKINYFIKRCEICGKSLIEIDKEKEEKKNGSNNSPSM